MGRLVRSALRRSLARIRHVSPVHPSQATGRVADVYADVEADFGMLAPPIALHSPAPEPLAAAWSLLRETLIADGLVDRAAKEAVAAAVSRSNTCPYCVEVHTATLTGLGAEARHTAIGAWADRSGDTLPFPAEHLPELLGTATAFHYLNRMVNLYLDDSPLPANAPAVASRFLGRFMGATARSNHTPGTSLRLLPAAELPADLEWTATGPVIADSLGRVAAAFDRAGARVLPADVRDHVAAYVAAWDGEPKGISRGWAEEAIAALRPGDRPAARLALLTALASYQVDDAVIAGFHRDDRSLVELTSWASFTAARRMASLTHRIDRASEA
ncbi:carboxymuconolactone decarboxylase family protein [Saccharothrix deserti]|uniref:carboxymuconolactone decarboxylase family protein n=1 Tax=Saccharothrix deserti TaxID=2593674 RepID=UPI00131D9128|nr:carboxymuconolactone decarboxylase family protein [Saccharothrix deserti]